MSMRAALRNQTILVTGGAGFIGSHLVDRLLVDGAAHVVVVDNLFLGNEDNLDAALATGRATFYCDDIEFVTSLEYIFGRHRIDTVFNCATKALNYSFLNPSHAFSTNVAGVLNLLELQRAGRFRSLCHFSTSEVYGTAVYEPMDEAHPRNPTTTYAAGKVAADVALESYVRMFGLDAFIVRPFNNYGPRQNHKGMLASIIPLTAWRVLNGIPPEIHGTGQQSRDFIHVADTVDAVVKLYDVMPAGDNINISANNQITVEQLIHRICDHFGYAGEIPRKEARKSDVLCHNASNARVQAMINYQLTPFDQGLAQTLDWYRAKLGQPPSKP
ncbi:MAG: NAD-dependent epimerase/dehydratase family protein [Betaproteobacteria bacterium]